MSLSSALSNALSGLTASARGAGVVSSNISNAMNDGYATRELSLSARTGNASGGVSVNGVNRLVNQALLGDRRQADGAQFAAQTTSGYLERLSTVIANPTEASSLTSLLADFEASLISSSSLPESETRLQAVWNTASSITDSLNTMSQSVQSLRAEADSAIDTQVANLNLSLEKVEQLNKDIIAAKTQGRDISGLMDQRQAAINAISKIVPVQELQRDMGAVALMTPGGAVVLDGQAAEMSFTPNNTVVAYMTLGNGLLSDLQINGATVSASDGGAMSGGSLGALFSTRDELLPDIQSELDTVALDLIERFSSGFDNSLAPGEPGLFWDAGAPPGATTGIASRIGLNTAADPDTGGLWRLRDGLGTTIETTGGNATLLQSMQAALNTVSSPPTDALGSASRNAASLFSDLLSSMGLRETETAKNLSFASARQSELTEMELAQGVDTDAEMQKLLLIEQSYAANAKIIQAVDEMLQQLMEIG